MYMDNELNGLTKEAASFIQLPGTAYVGIPSFINLPGIVKSPPVIAPPEYSIEPPELPQYKITPPEYIGMPRFTNPPGIVKNPPVIAPPSRSEYVVGPVSPSGPWLQPQYSANMSMPAAMQAQEPQQQAMADQIEPDATSEQQQDAPPEGSNVPALLKKWALPALTAFMLLK